MKALEIEPLWMRLRPKTPSEFIGNPIEVAALENKTGAILVDGQYGCGKTSAALVLGGAAAHATIPYTGQAWGTDGNGKPCFGWHLMPDDFDVKQFKQTGGGIFGAARGVYIIDEAQDLSEKQVTTLRALIDKAFKHSLYILVTTKPVALGSALRSRCYPVHMRPLNSEERTELVRRGWAALEMPDPMPGELLPALDRYEVTIPRVILNVVEKVSNGTPAEQAVLECRC